MEELLHYVWKHKLFPLAPLTTTDGKSVGWAATPAMPVPTSSMRR